ncbi:Lrp/AsnC family transcriptional regulator [Arenicella sp. 4NH20-0111]|uniref:Lrp/AsnC family transcriptional regulator n=1 Tax=Arenicella sp. 4NH20-0111 TaxID=3127648 RepID=UPI003105F15A
MIDLDPQDVKILELLQQDASRSTNEIAEKLNMSQSPCWRRINRLQQDGLITNTVALVNREAIGMDLVAFTTINLSQAGRKNMENFEAAVIQLDEVMECYTMTGAWDYMLKVVVKDIRQYEIFVRNQLLAKVPNIGEIHSHMAVTEIKNSTKLPLKSQLEKSS